MKNINTFILEKLKINSKTKIIHNNKILSPKDFDSLENIGIDYNGEEILVIGKPFKDYNDKNWEISMDYIHKKGYEIINGFDDIDNKKDFDYFVYACPTDNMEVCCYVYDESGVLVYEK